MFRLLIRVERRVGRTIFLASNCFRRRFTGRGSGGGAIVGESTINRGGDIVDIGRDGCGFIGESAGEDWGTVNGSG